MKKIALILFAAVFAIACKKENPNTESETTEKATDTTATLNSPCTNDITDALRVLGPRLCTTVGQDFIYEGHDIKESDFKDMYAQKWGTQNINFKTITWTELQKVMGTKNCYDIFLVFTFDPNATDNESITVQESTCYVEQEDKTSFSIPLFRAIERICEPTENSFAFSIGRGKGSDGIDRDMIIFMVTSAKGTFYFDISQVPTAVGFDKYQKK